MHALPRGEIWQELSSVSGRDGPLQGTGSPLYGDVFTQIGTNAYRVLLDQTLRTTTPADHMYLRLTQAGRFGLIDMAGKEQ